MSEFLIIEGEMEINYSRITNTPSWSLMNLIYEGRCSMPLQYLNNQLKVDMLPIYFIPKITYFATNLFFITSGYSRITPISSCPFSVE